MKNILLKICFLIALNSIAQEDTSSFFSTSKTAKSFYAPVGLIGLGVYSRENVPVNKYDIRTFRNQHFYGFHNKSDDVLQFVPLVVAYGLELSNLESKNKLFTKTALIMVSQGVMSAMVYPLKYGIADKRPLGAHNAWPSGHTAEAFLTATFLHKEYGHESIWISIGGYSCATSVAVLRILNDKHWSADVLAGAGFGILSANVTYLVFDYFKQKNKRKTLFR